MSIAGVAGLFGAVIDAFANRQAQNRAPGLAGQTAYNENYRGLIGRLDAARIAGIHPSLALGSNISGSGAPGFVGTDFAGALSNMAELSVREKENKAEREMRQAQQTAQEKRDQQERERNESEKMVNAAQVRNMEKQTEFIEEQIKASQEQRAREANRIQRTTATSPHDMVSLGVGRRGTVAVDNVGKNVVYVPNEVTRSNSKGEAAGTNPGYEWIYINGKRVKVPFGTTQNHEPSEVFQTFRDLDAAVSEGGIFGDITARMPWSAENNAETRRQWEAFKAWLRRSTSSPQNYRRKNSRPTFNNKR